MHSGTAKMARVLLAGWLGAAALAFGCGAPPKLPPPAVHYGISKVRTNAPRLKVNMARSDVQALLGLPTYSHTDEDQLHWKYAGEEDQRYVSLTIDFRKAGDDWIVHSWHWSL